ncbi:MAG: tRNA pseudouridine(55) synthase TruB [Deltaproteobacteria bacterium]|nr:tRNA pseudouridine(55) synthase TruB [Deltaproteobacteria bacterium]
MPCTTNNLSGVLVVDKPAGISSAKVVAIVKKALSAKKAGHAGTLDPFATGVLVCCINDATRLARFFLHDKKKYIALLHLGIETDTQDSTGAVTSTCKESDFSENTIRSVFKKFEGAIKQKPPVYSALKHKGVPLYKLARQGKPVQKPARSVFISYIDILEINLPFVRFEVLCSSGTYIRTLCSDIGTALGCGGHLKELRRTESSGFSTREAVTLSEVDELSAAGKLSDRLIKMSDALECMPGFIANNDLTKKIFHGSIITGNDIALSLVKNQSCYQKGFFKVLDSNNHLLSVLNYDQEKNRFKYCCVFHK